MKTKISTSLSLVAVTLFSSLPFTHAKAQTGSCKASWGSSVSMCTVYFTNTSTGTVSNTTYAWTFGDGQTSSLQSPSHTYSASGTYTVCLTVTVPSPNGNCTNTSCMPVTVQCPKTKACAANWNFQTGTASCTAYFTSSTAGATGWFWKFDDGQTSNLQNPVHTYSATGSYNVCLTVSVPSPTGGGICFDTLCKFITIYCPTGIAENSISIGSIENFPNPFAESTTINYSTLESGNVEIGIYNLLGEKAVMLVNEKKPSGSYSIPFNAGALTKGMYLLELKVNNNAVMKKINVLR